MTKPPWQTAVALSTGLLLLSSTEVYSDALALSNVLDGLRKSSFGTESILAIGDTVDALDVSIPKERCLDITDADIKADTPGSISAKLRFSFIRDVEQFQNTFKFSYNVEASSSANFAKIVGGETTLNNFGSFESFLKNDTESALIIIEAYSDQGRDIIQNFKFKPEYKDLLDKKEYKTFREKCGTHFIRGWTKGSGVRVVYEISGLDRESKFILENTMKGAASATVGIEDLSGTAKASLSNTISDTLRLASKIGKVRATVESEGGLGIATISRFVASGDVTAPDYFDNLLTKFSEAAKDFTATNAAPLTFLIAPHPGLTADNVDFNIQNFEKLGKIYKVLLRVDQRLATYESYKTRDIDLWTKYFKVATDELTTLRANLVKAYTECRNRGACDIALPDTVEGVILEDILSNGSLTSRCIHSYEHEDKVGANVVESFDYLSSISIRWKSNIKFLQSVDPQSTAIAAIGPDFVLRDLAFDPVRQQSVAVDGTGDDGRIILDLFRENIDRKLVDDGRSIDINKLRDIREKVAQTIFIARFRTLNGLGIEEVLGRPEVKDCPVYVPKQ